MIPFHYKKEMYALIIFVPLYNVSKMLLRSHLPANIDLFKVKNRNTYIKNRSIKIRNMFKEIDVVLVSLLLTMNIFHTFF